MILLLLAQDPNEAITNSNEISKLRVLSVNCLTFNVHCSLSIVRRSLSIVRRSLFVHHFPLFVVHCPLFVVHCSLFIWFIDLLIIWSIASLIIPFSKWICTIDKQDQLTPLCVASDELTYLWKKSSVHMSRPHWTACLSAPPRLQYWPWRSV